MQADSIIIIYIISIFLNIYLYICIFILLYIDLFFEIYHPMCPDWILELFHMDERAVTTALRDRCNARQTYDAEVHPKAH